MEKLNASYDKDAQIFLGLYKNPTIASISKLIIPEKKLVKLLTSSAIEIANESNACLEKYSEINPSSVDCNYKFSCYFFDSKEERSSIAGSTDEVSLKKNKSFVALAELIERHSYYKSKKISLKSFNYFAPTYLREDLRSTSPTTSGVAIQRTPALATEKALLELIERDAFLCHFYSNNRPEQISLPHSLFFQRLEAYKTKNKLNIGVFLLRSVIPSVKVVLITSCNLDTKSTSMFCMGLAADFSIEKAFNKAYLEFNRFIMLSKEEQGHSEQAQVELSTPMGRFYYYLKPENIEKVRMLLPLEIPNSTITEKSSFEENKKNVFCDDLKKNFTEVRVTPLPIISKLRFILFPCMVHVPQLQILDYENEPKINLQRLKSFTQNKNFEYTNQDLHPLP